MSPIIVFLVLVALQSASAQIDCIPEQVGEIILDLNYTLYWGPSKNCEGVSYIIYIRVEDDVRYIYNTQETFLNVSFLPHCEKFFFDVTPFSGNNLGEERHLQTFVPAPSGADLSIPHFSVIREDETLFLIWSMDEQFAHCSRGFRIVVRNEREPPRDLYTQHNYYFLDGLVPCGRYDIGVMAIYNDVMEGPISSVNYTHPPHNTERPTLQSVTPGPTYFDITIGTDPYSVNQCALISVVVNGYENFDQQIFPVEDSTDRAPITVRVTSLLPDRMYLVDVYVLNSHGWSRNLPVGVQTMPVDAN